jgi:hypothetical protein
VNSSKKEGAHRSPFFNKYLRSGFKLSGFFLLLGGILACRGGGAPNNVNNIISLKLEDSLVFKPGYLSELKHSGSFFCEALKEERFYFGNVASNKLIKVFSPEGVLHDSIPLNKVFEKGEGIDDFDFVSPDTILVLSLYTNHLYLLNRQGEIWKEYDLNDLIVLDERLKYELSASFFGRMLAKDTSLILALNLGLSKQGTWTPEDHRYLISKKWSLPHYARLDGLFGDTLHLSMGFSLYQEVAPEDSLKLLIDLKSYFIGEETVLVNSSFSDEIYELELPDLSLKQTHQLVSSYTAIGAETASLQEVDMTTAFQKMQEEVLTRGSIFEIIYQKEKQHYLIAIIHEREASLYKEEGYAPWSLMILNKNFQKIGELPMEGKKLLPHLGLKDGKLMIQKNSRGGKANDLQEVFYEYTY